MRLDYMIYLISTTISKNAIANSITIKTKKETYAEKNSIRQSEHYQAAASGLKPEIMFTIRAEEYKDESLLEFEGKEYKIIRTYEKNNGLVELVCTGLVIGAG